MYGPCYDRKRNWSSVLGHMHNEIWDLWKWYASLFLRLSTWSAKLNVFNVLEFVAYSRKCYYRITMRTPKSAHVFPSRIQGSSPWQMEAHWVTSAAGSMCSASGRVPISCSSLFSKPAYIQTDYIGLRPLCFSTEIHYGYGLYQVWLWLSRVKY